MDKLLLHPHTEEVLKRIISSPVHAVGIEGKDGSGKKQLANHMVRKIMNVSDINTNPYIRTIDCDKKAGIDEVRGAISFLSLRIPGDERYKRCLIFYSFEKLSHEGQNSLLKSLEEPPDDTIIIITTESKSTLLPTTVSRLRWLSVLPVDEDSAMAFFKDGYDKEKIKNAHTVSGGRVGLMKELLEDYDGHPLAISIKKAKEIISMDRFERLATLDEFIKSPDVDMKLYFWAMAKVLQAAMKSQLAKSGTVSKNLLRNLKLTAKAQNAQKYNVNQKALLSELFYNL